jgi:hypothetical protein
VSGIFNRCAVAACIVAVSRDAVLRVGDGRDQPDSVVGELGEIPQRIGNLGELAFGVIRKVSDATRKKSLRSG